METPDSIYQACWSHENKWYQEFHINMLDAYC